jgi:ribose/xylose/arabinose/galactoside ABC-type transport system permease subunit
VLFSAYAVAGVVIAFAAWILIGRVNGADTNSGINANLEASPLSSSAARACSVGRGVVIGSLDRALIVQVFENGLGAEGRRRQLPGVRHRRARHRRRLGGPVDQAGEGMTCD